ncbi:Alpha-hemolysin translocation ATP-binding protein HlyB [compost metagenome]|uniref:peptidase domain-containing ABC transporter n=1 Tax=Agrobacterium tumefaciens complex TaxID=1183400 RepID=UPI000DD341E5|nr:peptidase domain-containing ABC transporter [Agrobacterium tumefaciens]MBP2509808.1 subfamily B ATP-binding cassette protein HlyB/CyaB [Agrobacterium tumefaciens]MBP2518651.1 subfamily B ATP-binding cassette protein HlyB/CyaB [Agrobacterium tumefaciens]MBP2578001.1 subfamily B ATP-binding cassette protein HlyB/CyaB [Agrobacterium tumefaciens]MBP2595947.1 subfamily B ATP-binding cassette protein HlyB/CyaB [Agrobacterium tumefaciens]UXS12504.1 peptidase domain-containing ABC transporter [Agro
MIAETMVIAVVLRLLGLVEPFVFQTIIDRVLPFQREATLTLIVVVLVLTMLASALLSALVAYLGSHMANRLITELARRIFRHVLNLPLLFLQRWPAGETLARVGETDTVRGFLTGTISSAILDVLFAVVYVGALLAISPFLTMVVLVTLPLQAVAFALIGPFLRRRMQESFFAASRHQSRLVEAFGNITTVKALAGEEQQIERFHETLSASLNASFHVTKLEIINGFFGQTLSNIPGILIIFLGSQLVFRNQITLGELVAFHLLAEHVFGPIMSLATIWEKWQGLKIARLRLGDFLNTPTETDTHKLAIPIDGSLVLSLKNVSFGYTPDEPIICDMSMEIGPGVPTLIIGESGCGKSTLAKLISGLYLPKQGTIAANGYDLTDYNPHTVRRAIAYLPQEPVLFSGTILDNLLLAKADATEMEILQALSDSASDRLVAQLPDGIHTEVGERGSYLSGGQRQRIALARTLLSNPQALILDEPTSALDAQAAAHITEMLNQLARDKTLVVITHKADLLGNGANVINLSGGPYFSTLPDRMTT